MSLRVVRQTTLERSSTVSTFSSSHLKRVELSEFDSGYFSGHRLSVPLEESPSISAHHHHQSSFNSEHNETWKSSWKCGRYGDDQEPLLLLPRAGAKLSLRGDRDTSRLAGNSTSQKSTARGNAIQQGSWKKERETAFQVPVKNQNDDGSVSSSSPSSLSRKSNVHCISRARQIMVVNVLGVNDLVMQYGLEVFGVPHKSGSSMDTSTTRNCLQLMQVLGCVTDMEGPTWIGSSEIVEGEGVEPILYNTCTAPLLVVLPMDRIVTTETSSSMPTWVAQFKKLFGCFGESQRQIVFLGIHDYHRYDDRQFKYAVINGLGMHTDHMLFMSKSSNPAITSSVYSTILKVLTPETTSVSTWLEVEKMVILERLNQTENMPLRKLISELPDPTLLFKHLFQTGIGFAISCDLRREVEVSCDGQGASSIESKVMTDSCKQSPLDVQGYNNCQLILQPNVFSDEVCKLSDVCKITHREINDSLMPVAQHGLIPKDKITSSTLLLQDLHKSHLILDPMLTDSGVEQGSEALYVVSNESRSPSYTSDYAFVDGRDCYLVPSCLRNESLTPLVGYTRIPSLAFRCPGSYKKVISVSAFHQLVAYLLLRFPSLVKCRASAARFHIAPQHILDVTYAETYIKATVYVLDGVSALPTACSTVKDLICTQLKALSNASSSYIMHPAAVIDNCNSQHPDFVDLVDVDPLRVKEELYSIGGQLFLPSDEFLVWFGDPGAVQEEIRGQLRHVIEEIDPLRATYSLYQKKVFSSSDVDRMLSQDVHAQSLLLVRLLEKRRSKGLEAIDGLLRDNTLRKRRWPGINVETQTSPNVTQVRARHHEGSRYLPESEVMAARASRDPNLQQNSDRKPQWVNQLGTSPEMKTTNAERSSRVPLPGQSGTTIGAHSSASPLSPPASSYQENQGLSAGSRVVMYSGIHEDELAFPRSQPTAITAKVVRPISQQATEADTENTNRKGDPEIHPIFESKYWHVERATDTFNEVSMKDGGKRLGVGSFGTVFHGVLHSETGQTFQVAVKRLKKASSLSPSQVALSRKQFGTEMNVLTRYLHKNIVRLLGFSSDGPELCLIYEYMERGALSHRLDCKHNSPPLDWRVRLTIARDIGSALAFLHTAYRLPVIHRDVKSSNVLLNASFEAKLSDFGLAMVKDADGDMPIETERQSSVGTRPYMAPEIFEGIISTKGDIYSLGMVLFELATGLPPYSSRKKQDLKAYLEDMERQSIDMVKMLDPKARWPKSRDEESRDKTVGLELLQVAKLATISDHTMRPDILQVLPELKSLVDKN